MHMAGGLKLVKPFTTLLARLHGNLLVIPSLEGHACNQTEESTPTYPMSERSYIRGTTKVMLFNKNRRTKINV